MKIVHFCLSCFYIDGFAYQENQLVAQHVKDGHDVTVIASTETYNEKRQLAYVEPAEYIGADGAKVIRLPYRGFLPARLSRKIRAYPGVWKLLDSIQPDVILFHGLCAWELLTVAKYVREHPRVALFADCHEDFNNSARTFASRYFLHLGFYRRILRRCLPVISEVLCVSGESIDFAKNFYGVPAAKIEFFPLGGEIVEDHEYAENRRNLRAKHHIDADAILFVQSGKIDRTKKLLEALRSFMLIDAPNFRFLVVGHLQDDVADEAKALISQDARIQYLGWKTPEELRGLLCAADVYVQPGTQSATMQMGLCCRCAVILDDVPSHQPYVDGNGWLVGKEMTLDHAFRSVADMKESLPLMSERSASIASRILDYRVLAARLYR